MTHVDHHPLASDFPEHRQTIHELKQSDAHFRRLFDEYEALDRSVIRIEQGLEHLSDLELDKLKMQRVVLKDELYQMLIKARNTH